MNNKISNDNINDDDVELENKGKIKQTAKVSVSKYVTLVKSNNKNFNVEFLHETRGLTISELHASGLTWFYYSLFSLIYNEKYDYRYRHSNRIIINFTSQKKKKTDLLHLSMRE